MASLQQVSPTQSIGFSSMQVKHIFFDLDRTLWDFEANSRETLFELYREKGLDQVIPNFKNFHYSYIHINNELWKLYGRKKITKDELRIERFRRVLNKFNQTDEELVSFFNEEYVNRSPKKKKLFPGSIDVLAELHRSGYSLHILTNGFREVQETKITTCGIAPYISELICSEDVGYNKPHIELFSYALKLIGSKSRDSIMIGDDYEIDIVGALNAGMNAILFDPDNCKRNARDFKKVTELSEIPAIIPFVFPVE